MSVALQVFLLVLAILVAIAGIGVALALRTSSRQRHRVSARKTPSKTAGRARKSADNVVPLGNPVRAASSMSTMAVPATPAVPPTPEEAHQAKLQALQALLALGDAKAAGSKSAAHFADTEPAEDGHAATQFSDRADAGQSPLLNLDKLDRRRRGARP